MLFILFVLMVLVVLQVLMILVLHMLLIPLVVQLVLIVLIVIVVLVLLVVLLVLLVCMVKACLWYKRFCWWLWYFSACGSCATVVASGAGAVVSTRSNVSFRFADCTGVTGSSVLLVWSWWYKL